MKKSTWIIGGVLVLLGVAALAQATVGRGAGWCPYHRMAGGPLDHIARALDMNDAQKAQVKSLWEGERSTVLPLVRQLADGRKQMEAATSGGNFEEDRVRAIANQQAQTIAQLLVEKERLTSKVYSSVLTPEQRTKADQMRARMDSHIDQFLNHMSQADH